MGISNFGYDGLNTALSNVYSSALASALAGKPPSSWDAILADKSVKITAQQSAYNDSLPKDSDAWHGSYYGEVGRALGFTKQEIDHLVNANDSGLSFATLAALIDEHPPVYSSAMTPTRKIEEAAFCKNVLAAVKHHQVKQVKKVAAGYDFFNVPAKQQKYFMGSDVALGPKPKSPNAVAFGDINLLPMSAPSAFPWLTYSESLLIDEAYMGKQKWKKQQAHDDKIASMQMMVEAMKKTLISPDILADWGADDGSTYNPYEGIAKVGAGSFVNWQGAKANFKSALAPKPGELAKLLGIWTP